MATRGISEAAAELFTLGCVPDGQEFAGRLSIPYITPTGVIQIKYRCTDLDHGDSGDHHGVQCPKYLYEAGCGTHLYEARQLIHAAGQVVLTEGELDAITIRAYCGVPAVGYPGVKNWKPFYRLCFNGVSDVVVIADGDDVGREAANRIAEKIGANARVVDLGDGYDANKYITELGAAAFKERIN